MEVAHSSKMLPSTYQLFCYNNPADLNLFLTYHQLVPTSSELTTKTAYGDIFVFHKSDTH